MRHTQKLELSRCASGHLPEDIAFMHHTTGGTEEKHEHRFIVFWDVCPVVYWGGIDVSKEPAPSIIICY